MTTTRKTRLPEPIRADPRRDGRMTYWFNTEAEAEAFAALRNCQPRSPGADMVIADDDGNPVASFYAATTRA